MSTTLRVVICDDDVKRAKSWREYVLTGLVNSGVDPNVSVLEVPDLVKALGVLGARQLQARGYTPDPSDVNPDESPTAFDDADLVILDYDLTPSSRNSSDLQRSDVRALQGELGDVIARLVRAYSTAGAVVVVNKQFQAATFDLTHRAYAHFGADLYLSEVDLMAPGLWTGAPAAAGYRPWHWPRLLGEPARLRALQATIDLDEQILKTLGLLDDDVLATFAEEQLTQLGPDATTATFEQIGSEVFLAGTPKGAGVSAETLKRCAVAAVTQWLERVVLPAQNVLIDVPHLAVRRPDLVVEGSQDSWGGLATLEDGGWGSAALLEPAANAAAAGGVGAWLSRPVYVRALLPPAVSTAFDSTLVFCEDMSAFREIDDCREYQSLVAGPFKQRFVRGDATHGAMDVEYRPARLFF